MAGTSLESGSDDRPICPGCGASVIGKFCHRCGARARYSRLDLRALLTHAFGQFLELDLPIFRTIMDLTANPGRTCSRYISGNRARYTNPFKYCLLTTALFVLVVTLFDVSIVNVNLTSSSGTDESSRRMAALSDACRVFVQQNYNVLILLALPPLALATRLLFRRARLNLAEHYVFGLYVIGHFTLLRAVIAPFGALSLPTLRVVIVCIQLAFFCWAAKVFFEVGWFGAAWRSMLATLALGLFTIVAGVLAALVVVVLPSAFA